MFALEKGLRENNHGVATRLERTCHLITGRTLVCFHIFIQERLETSLVKNLLQLFHLVLFLSSRVNEKGVKNCICHRMGDLWLIQMDCFSQIGNPPLV